MQKALIFAVACIALSGCATAPTTPKDAYLNRYAGAEVIAKQCPAYGGYGSVTQMRADAQKNLAEAKKLGATEADVQAARNRVNGSYMAAAILVGPFDACHALLNNLAWAGTSEPQIIQQASAQKR